jgi:hypothetical protein
MIYHSRTQPSYATGLNYTRISKSNRWAFEFGIRYTQLNWKSDKRYNSYVGSFAKDTFTLSRGFTSFFDIPVNFKRLIKINEKSNFVFNLGVFYTTYIQDYVRWKTYLSADNSLLSEGSRQVHMFHYLKLGIDVGLGFNRKIRNDAELYFTLHPVNVRFETDWEGDGFGFPNFSVGYRKSF